jgi:hypothetical protein
MRAKVFALVSAVLLLVTLAIPHSGAEVAVLRVSQDPENPTPDDDVVITVELTNSSEVNKSYISWCQANPELCFTPKEMKYIGADTYSFDLGKFPNGQEIKYNITILLKNGNTTVTPTVHFKVEKAPPSDGGGGNNNTTNNTDGNKTDGGNGTPSYMVYGLIVVFVMVMIAAVVAVLLRRKKPGSA